MKPNGRVSYRNSMSWKTCSKRNVKKPTHSERKFVQCNNNTISANKGNLIYRSLRVVQTKAILFLQSMSERVGPDIERLWIWMTLSSIDNRQNFWIGVVVCRIRFFPTKTELSSIWIRGRGTGTAVLGRRRTPDGEGRGTEAFLQIRPLQGRRRTKDR